MKKGEHTPGPWTARPYNVNSGRVAEWSIDSKNWSHLALVCVQEDDTATECELGDGDANANLIAAAPDLLAVCERLLELDLPHCRNMLEAVVKKVRGET